MAENQFEELVKDVSTEEKDDLLEKIRQSIVMPEPGLTLDSLPESNQKNGNKAKKVTAEMKVFAESNYKKLRPLDKLIFKMLMFFQKKDLHSLVVEKKLDELRHFIQSSGSYVDFDKKAVTPKFSSEIYTLYLVCQPLRPVFMKIWRSSEMLEALVADLLKLNSSVGEKREITDFISTEQMLEAYSKNSDSNDVRRAVLRSVKSSLEALPEAKFKEIKEMLLPFYYVQALIVFPFNEIFTLLGVTAQQTIDEKKPLFKVTPISVVMDYLVKFSYALYMATNMTFDEATAKLIFEHFFSDDDLDEKELKRQVEIKLRYLKELQTVLADFNKRVPLIEIIRYYKGDPLFKIDVIPPRLDLKQFYTNAVRLMVLNTFPAAMQEVKVAFIGQSIEHLFKDIDVTPLNYYIPFKDTDWERWNLPLFAHHQSAMLTYNFLHRWCKTRLSPIIMILSSTVLAKSAPLQAKINEFRSSIEFLEERIRRFDLSLAPETEAGKTLSSLKAGVQENSTQLRLLRSFLMQKDIEICSLLTEIIEVFGDFTRFTVAKVMSSGVESVKTSLATVYPSIDRYRSFNDLLQEALNEIQNFSLMMKELIEYEKSGNALR